MKRILVATGAAIAVVGAVVGASAGAADARARTRGQRASSDDLVVTLVTPTVNQEVLPGLTDPGLNNVITVRFSAPVRTNDIIDNQNVFNRLTPKVEFTDSTFARLPGTPQVKGNTFRFDPRTDANGGELPAGQYTLNLKSAIRSTGGKLLNAGAYDTTSTFSVGTDSYGPVLRKISPINNQTNIGLNQRIVMTFNEPILAASVISTIQVQNASTNPPTAIPGAGGGTGVTLERNGFDVVFTPDKCFGYPPKTTIQFLVQGKPETSTATVSTVSDVFGNQFARDAGLQWTLNPATSLYDSPNGTYDPATGVFRMVFVTKGITPPPVGLAPGSPIFVPFPPFGSPCKQPPLAGVYLRFSNSCSFIGRGFLYTTATGVGELDITPVIQRFNQGITDLSLIAQVPNSPVRMGRPLAIVVDPRWDVANVGHTFLYVVDQRSATVLVVDSRNLKVIGRFGGFSAPRDVTIAHDLGNAYVTLLTTDFASSNLVGVDLSAIAVNLNGQPGAQSPCDAIKDVQDRRTTLAVGRGPIGVAADSFLFNKAIVVNSFDNSASVIDVKRNVVSKTVDVGGNPLDVDWTLYGFGSIDVACISNQGGLNDPNGSISLYVRAPPLGGGILGAAQNRDGVEFTLTDGVKNPTNVWGNQWCFYTGTAADGGIPGGPQWLIPNSGGKDVFQLFLQVSGLFGLQISVQANQARTVGLNPTSSTFDAYYPNGFWYTAVPGQGQIAGLDPVRNIPSQNVQVPGIRRLFTCFSH